MNDEGVSRPRLLVHPSSFIVSRAAYAAAVLNLVAPLATLTLLRPGMPLPGSTLTARMAYVSSHTGAWRAGWLVWHAAAIALLLFYLALALRWWTHAPLRCGLALLCAGAGMAVDLGAQAVYIGLAPSLDGGAYAMVERAAIVLTGYFGNGMYTLAGILLVWAGAAELSRPLALLSAPVWAAGVALSAASLLDSATGQFWSTAVLMPALALWSVFTGRWLSSEQRATSNVQIPALPGSNE
jgi:hypothetical protein